METLRQKDWARTSVHGSEKRALIVGVSRLTFECTRLASL